MTSRSTWATRPNGCGCSACSASTTPAGDRPLGQLGKYEVAVAAVLVGLETQHHNLLTGRGGGHRVNRLGSAQQLGEHGARLAAVGVRSGETGPIVFGIAQLTPVLVGDTGGGQRLDQRALAEPPLARQRGQPNIHQTLDALPLQRGHERLDRLALVPDARDFRSHCRGHPPTLPYGFREGHPRPDPSIARTIERAPAWRQLATARCRALPTTCGGAVMARGVDVGPPPLPFADCRTSSQAA